MWHKQECDYNGHEYKGGLLYLVVLVNNTMIFTPCIDLKAKLYGIQAHLRLCHSKP